MNIILHTEILLVLLCENEGSFRQAGNLSHLPRNSLLILSFRMKVPAGRKSWHQIFRDFEFVKYQVTSTEAALCWNEMNGSTTTHTNFRCLWRSSKRSQRRQISVLASIHPTRWLDNKPLIRASKLSFSIGKHFETTGL